jgi:hypothetical protein
MDFRSIAEKSGTFGALRCPVSGDRHRNSPAVAVAQAPRIGGSSPQAKRLTNRLSRTSVDNFVNKMRPLAVSG